MKMIKQAIGDSNALHIYYKEEFFMNSLDRAIISATAWATNNSADPTSGVQSFLNKWVGYSKSVGWIVALLCIVIVAIMFMIPSEENHRNAKKYAIYILVGAALLSVGPTVITAMQNGVA